jgi:hypothetical protein
MLKRFAALLCVLPLLAIGVFAQGLNTSASKDDWEEINYEFNSSVLVDGFPSLLRLSELLQKNPGYKVRLEGHTDRIGGDDYNEKLGLARANTVRDFLVKYGARPGQIDVGTRGKADPKYPGQKPTYSKTDEARWMNRRVVMTVTDDQGRTISAAGVGDAIRAMEPRPAAGMTDCCSEVLKRLDKLDDIAKALQALADQNAALRRELDALKQGQQVLESKANQPGAPAAAPPSADNIAKEVAQEIKKEATPKFQLLGVNLGEDSDQHLTASGMGRFFGTFGEHYAVQAQGDFTYYKDQKEGEADLGLVDRMGRFQAGLFGSVKHVALSGNQNGGNLGQASLTLDYLFKHGKIGAYGTYAFMNSAQINSVAAVLANGITSPDLLDERFLRAINQAGASFSFGLWGNNYLEGNVGYLKSEMYGDRAGGTVRFVFPLNKFLALTLEGGLNETLLGAGNSGFARVGVRFGSTIKPKEFLAGTTPVPVDVPQIRYEIINRTVRTGHTPPVANAGPNQIGVPAGTITLNGSQSYSPDGLPITYQWTGGGVVLSNPTAAITTFTAAAGQAYTFELTVTDSLGGKGSAYVRVTTTAALQAQAQFFIANPSTITAGQSSTLQWGTLNATTVTISGLGSVPLSGTQSVSPTVTTTYTLTATNATSNQMLTATVVVNPVAVNIGFCTATPMNISAGQSSTLSYQTSNATAVVITPGVGSVPANGTYVVSPTVSTNYTVTATGAGGATTSCSVAVTVTPGAVPQVISFSAVPATINSGQTSTLAWTVQNAATVTISPGLGSVSLNGSQVVTPAATTTYILTATNSAGSVTASATVNVNVIAPPLITSFTANPNPSPSPTSPVLLSCQTQNAVSVTMGGILFLPGTSMYYEHPTQNTTYTCIATGQNGQTVSQSVTVTVNMPTVPPPTTPPVIVISGGPSITIQSPEFQPLPASMNFTPDASNTYSPAGNNPLTFAWTSSSAGVSIAGGNTAKPTITVATPGNYVVNLAVTDSKGNVTNQVVALDWQFNAH